VVSRGPAETPAKPVAVAPTPAPTPKPVSPAPVTYIKKVPVTTTAYPVSNPNGFTDLEISLVSAKSFSTDKEGVIQVVVKNIGTKTSKDWSFSVSYPGEDDDSYTSKSQKSLLPGERSITTIRFVATDNDGVGTINAKVTTSGDQKSINNSVSKKVTILD
jgi:hypothetical protein